MRGARLPVRTCAVLFSLFTPMSAQGSPERVRECPPGTLIEPYSGVCAPVDDARVVPSDAKLRMRDVPDLEELRLRNLPRAERAVETVPPPGGIGAGTVYKLGSLQALEHAELHTKMFVHPDGVRPSAPGLSWLFSTATNRAEKGVEVVGIYFESVPSGSLGVFDWSCSPDDPCAGGETDPSWIWTRDFTEFACNMTDILDEGGHRQTVIQYANQTRKLDDRSPALWRNAVHLWNACDEQWDLVYEHHYRTVAADCSRSGCASWGPIMETFSDSLPEIDEVGFEDSLLLHDGVSSLLGPDETNFRQPASPWVLFHLDPNRSFGVGNRTLTVITVTIDISPGSRPNSINPRSRGVIAVAVLSNGSFDATQVDALSVELGPDGAREAHGRGHVTDVDRDGDPDMVLHFATRETGIRCGDSEAVLTGRTFAGEELMGTDSIRTVSCRSK